MTSGHPWRLSNKESACNAGATGDAGSILGSERFHGEGHRNPLQNILAWIIPWTEESGRLQSIGAQRVGRD